MDSVGSYKELDHQIASICKTIVCSFVNNPDSVHISLNRRKLVILVSDQDRGSVIGRAGQNLRAIEDMLHLSVQYLTDSQQISGYELPSIEVRVNQEEQDT